MRDETRRKKRQSKDKPDKQFSFALDAWRRFKRNRTALIGLVLIAIYLLMMIFAGVISPYDPNVVDYSAAKQPPSSEHWFGTDHIGRDTFSRCMYGARTSIPIGILCMVSSLVVGGLLGMCAAFFGGKTDIIIMRAMDVFQAIPGVLMAITIIATIGNGIPQLVMAMTISFMPNFARSVRAAFFTVQGSEYVEAARSIGARSARLMLRHILPNAIGHVVVFAVSIVSVSIMVVATLSYVGLGVRPPTSEWGSLLSSGKDFLASFPHMVLFPGIMIMGILLAFNLFGDGLRDALDPRLK